MPFLKADAGVRKLIDKALPAWHLKRLGLTKDPPTIAAVYYEPKRDKNGAIVGPPLLLHGYQCIATIKLNSVKNRVQGLSDCTITIDRMEWDKMKDDEQIAVIDHELEHLESVLKSGAVDLDDAMRPKLKLKNHDWQIGGFQVVVERHKQAATEFQQAEALSMKYGQLLFAFAATAASKKRELELASA